MGGVVGYPKCRHGLDADSCKADKKFEKAKPNAKRKRRKKGTI